MTVVLNLFRYNGKPYRHLICLSDDSTHFKDEDGALLMSICSSGYVTLNGEPKRVAQWSMDRDMLWCLYPMGQYRVPIFTTGNKDLIKAEMKYFKHWLEQQSTGEKNVTSSNT